MSGYVAIGRVQGVRVRRVSRADRLRDDVAAPAVVDTACAVDRRPIRERLAQAREMAREQWAITTFFLFDPESWR